MHLPPPLAITFRSIEVHRIRAIVGGDGSHHARSSLSRARYRSGLVSTHDTKGRMYAARCPNDLTYSMHIARIPLMLRRPVVHVDVARLISLVAIEFSSVPITQGLK